MEDGIGWGKGVGMGQGCMQQDGCGDGVDESGGHVGGKAMTGPSATMGLAMNPEGVCSCCTMGIGGATCPGVVGLGGDGLVFCTLKHTAIRAETRSHVYILKRSSQLCKQAAARVRIRLSTVRRSKLQQHERATRTE